MADARRIDDVIRDAAKAASIDVEKWSFDADALKFIPREKPAAAAVAPAQSKTTPPKGGTPN